MSLAFPTTFSDIRAWCSQSGVNVSEGRDRFAQYAILRAIASSRTLSRMLVFKGGNALDFVWHPNRSTRDLDFSADMSVVGSDWESGSFESSLKTPLEMSLRVVRDKLGVVSMIHNVKKQPPGPGKTFVTFELRVGYALPDQTALIASMSYGKPSTQVIPIEVSLNELICADKGIDIQAPHLLRVSTLEDIVAEKLRALLQQPIRNRGRRQDLLDVALLVQEHAGLDRSQIAEFLLRKSATRGVPVSRSAFHHPEVARRAKHDYDSLSKTTRRTFVPYEEALRTLLEFTDSLPLPLDAPETTC